jgi:hypothetical protein
LLSAQNLSSLEGFLGLITYVMLQGGSFTPMSCKLTTKISSLIFDNLINAGTPEGMRRITFSEDLFDEIIVYPVEIGPPPRVGKWLTIFIF